MPAFLRMKIFPRDMQRTIDLYTKVLRFKVLRHEESYANFQRDDIFIGASTSPPEQSLPVAARYRRPPTGVEIVIEVDNLEAERDFVVSSHWPLDADIELQAWDLRDFRIVDPDGYYLRITEHSKSRDGRGDRIEKSD